MMEDPKELQGWLKKHFLLSCQSMLRREGVTCLSELLKRQDIIDEIMNSLSAGKKVTFSNALEVMKKDVVGNRNVADCVEEVKESSAPLTDPITPPQVVNDLPVCNVSAWKCKNCSNLNVSSYCLRCHSSRDQPDLWKCAKCAAYIASSCNTCDNCQFTRVMPPKKSIVSESIGNETSNNDKYSRMCQWLVKSGVSDCKMTSFMQTNALTDPVQFLELPEDLLNEACNRLPFSEQKLLLAAVDKLVAEQSTHFKAILQWLKDENLCETPTDFLGLLRKYDVTETNQLVEGAGILLVNDISNMLSFDKKKLLLVATEKLNASIAAVFASMLQWVETKKICAGSDLFDLLKLHNITKPVHLLKLPEDVINEISNRLSFSGKRHFAKVMDCLKVDPCPSDAVEVVKSNVSEVPTNAVLLWLTELKISGKVSDILEANGITDKCQLLSMDPVANEMSNRMNVAEKRAFSKALLSLKPGSTNVVPAMADKENLTSDTSALFCWLTELKVPVSDVYDIIQLHNITEPCELVNRPEVVTEICGRLNAVKKKRLDKAILSLQSSDKNTRDTSTSSINSSSASAPSNSTYDNSEILAWLIEHKVGGDNVEVVAVVNKYQLVSPSDLVANSSVVSEIYGVLKPVQKTRLMKAVNAFIAQESKTFDVDGAAEATRFSDNSAILSWLTELTVPVSDVSDIIQLHNITEPCELVNRPGVVTEICGRLNAVKKKRLDKAILSLQSSDENTRDTSTSSINSSSAMAPPAYEAPDITMVLEWLGALKIPVDTIETTLLTYEIVDPVQLCELPNVVTELKSLLKMTQGIRLMKAVKELKEMAH